MTYTSSNPAAFTIANYGPSTANPAGWWGSVIFHTIHTNAPSGTATASLCTSLTGSAGTAGAGERNLITATLDASLFGPASTPQLTSIVVSPNQVRYDDNNLNNANNVEVSCFATGFYSDGTVKDLTNQVTWSVTNTSGGGTPTFASANLLKLVQAEGTDTVTITATYTGSDPVAAGVGHGDHPLLSPRIRGLWGVEFVRREGHRDHRHNGARPAASLSDAAVRFHHHERHLHGLRR